MGTATAEAIDRAIEEIVKAVPPGHIFDSHFVISQLIKKSTDRYLSFAAKAAPGSRKPTLPTHGKIGQKINRLAGIENLGAAWSENIRETPSKCTCWKKLKKIATKSV